MSVNTSLPINHGSALDVNILSKSPHIVAYRLWRRLSGTDWVLFAEGDSADEVSDHHELSGMSAGSRVAYWLGIGGNPNTQYRALVTIAQAGRILDGGSFIEEGSTNAQGVAEAQAIIEFP
jgi:hypothetical protein